RLDAGGRGTVAGVADVLLDPPASRIAHGVELRKVMLGVEPWILDARDDERRRCQAGAGGVGRRGYRVDKVFAHNRSSAGSVSSFNPFTISSAAASSSAA